MKINKKVIKILLMLVMVIFLFTTISDAATMVNKFKGETDGFEGADTKIKSAISAVLSIVRIIGGAVAAGILMIIATKYMLSSAGERAEIKKSAVVYVLGAIVLFGAPKIVDILVDFAK